MAWYLNTQADHIGAAHVFVFEAFSSLPKFSLLGDTISNIWIESPTPNQQAIVYEIDIWDSKLFLLLAKKIWKKSSKVKDSEE